MVKENEKSALFGRAEANLLDGKTEDGNFHVKFVEEIEKKAVGEGHFYPLKRRIMAINSVLDDIINWQNEERKSEGVFKDY